MPLLLIALLVPVSWQVAVRGPLLGLDRTLRHATAGFRDDLHNPLVNGAAHLFADLGSTVPAIPLLLGGGALAAWRWRRADARRWWLPVPVAVLAALLIPLLVVPAKAWFARPGPLGEPLAPGAWGWYPSGHTTTACVGYGVAALLLARPGRRAGWWAAGAAALWLGVGWGLLWCDYHWFLDVLAGWCLSGLVLWCLHRWLPRVARPEGS